MTFIVFETIPRLHRYTFMIVLCIEELGIALLTFWSLMSKIDFCIGHWILSTLIFKQKLRVSHYLRNMKLLEYILCNLLITLLIPYYSLTKKNSSLYHFMPLKTFSNFISYCSSFFQELLVHLLFTYSFLLIL